MIIADFIVCKFYGDISKDYSKRFILLKSKHVMRDFLVFKEMMELPIVFRTSKQNANTVNYRVGLDWDDIIVLHNFLKTDPFGSVPQRYRRYPSFDFEC
ncbi:hypothetical protein JTB14_011108 [Gonioctena quinquepunctata]|nr:hypothetical protein JTB14_011108 [Gonioctena quinquepunctata]